MCPLKRVKSTSERVICHCQARLPPFVCRLLLHFEQRDVAVTALEQYEAKVKVPPSKGRSNIQQPSNRSFGLGQMAATHLNQRQSVETDRVQRILSECSRNLPQCVVPTTECERKPRLAVWRVRAAGG